MFTCMHRGNSWLVLMCPVSEARKRDASETLFCIRGVCTLSSLPGLPHHSLSGKIYCPKDSDENDTIV